jgi:ABC-type multidrug transport system fused ATPase/permease subunit
LLRLYQIESGRITLNNVDVKEIPLSVLRRRLCRVILQDARFTEPTLRENLISGGGQRSNVTDVELRQVLERVGLGGFDLDALVISPSGKDLLSEGERQLVCIARVLVGTPPPILLCDECTSFVDEELDNKVHDELLGLRQTTVISILHRESQLHKFDFKLVVEGGKVAEFVRL